MDPLTQAIALLRPRALLWKRMQARGPWALQFPANDGVVFCLVGAGSCYFQGPGRARTLNAGDLILMSRPPVWSLSDSAGSSAELRPGHPAPSGGEVAQVGDSPQTAGEGPVTRTLGGHFAIDRANAALLDGLLPAFTAVRAHEPDAVRLRAILALIGDEALAERPGRDHVLERLLEVMLVEAIRRQTGQGAQVGGGLLAGLADPRVGPALRALHDDIARDWSVAALARTAGMSRSAFAARFTEVVGLAPIDYRLRWRMAVAKDLLRTGRARLAEVAEACGYRSASAFSAAFARTEGVAPSRYADGKTGVEAQP